MSRIDAAFALIGIGLITAGAYQISPPVGFIVLGVALIAAAAWSKGS